MKSATHENITIENRLESDSLGQMELPGDAYYGIQTERAKQNFNIYGETQYDAKHYIWAVAAIKKAAARANHRCGVLDEKISHSIEEAANEVMNGGHANQFPICIYQGGGGTSTNMNVNEVLANRANEILTGRKGYDRVHPNDHVNLGQSTNDVIPAAMKIACFINLDNLSKTLRYLERSLSAKADEFHDIVKLARTCLQDAVPITLGQQFSGYASLASRCIAQVKQVMEQTLELPLGATAVGTELNSAHGYLKAVYEELHEILGIEFKNEPNFFDGLQNADLYLDISNVLKKVATGLSKFSTDLRIMSSGPRAGLNEINLPSVQPGSSIMPGKVNPVMPELLNQVCYRVCGNDTSVTMAVEGGELDLNVWEPIIIKSISESCELLLRSIPLFVDKCIKGITANADICRSYAENSVALSAVISAKFDYKTGSKVARKALAENKTVKAVAVEMGLFTEELAEKYLNPNMMVDNSKYSQLINKQ